MLPADFGRKTRGEASEIRSIAAYRERARKLHNARTERTRDNIPLAPSAMFVQTQKNIALALVVPYRPRTSPLPRMGRIGTPDARIDPIRMMISPHRRSGNTSVAESQTARMRS